MLDSEPDPLATPAPSPAESNAHLASDYFFQAAEPALVPGKANVFPPWSGGDVVAVFAFTLAAIFLFSLIAMGIARIATVNRHVPGAELATNPIVIIGSQVVAYPAVLLFMMALVGRKSSCGFWQSIRWNWPGARAVGFVVAGSVFALGVDFVSRYLPIPKSLPIDNYFSELTGAYLMAAFGVTLAPLLEELFFRGLFYPLVRRSVGVAPAVLLTATLFAFIHGAQLGYAWAPLLSIFVVGVVFTLVREKTESVAASFLMHCGYNLALFGMLWIGSDHFRHLDKVVN